MLMQNVTKRLGTRLGTLGKKTPLTIWPHNLHRAKHPAHSYHPPKHNLIANPRLFALNYEVYKIRTSTETPIALAKPVVMSGPQSLNSLHLMTKSNALY